MKPCLRSTASAPYLVALAAAGLAGFFCADAVLAASTEAANTHNATPRIDERMNPPVMPAAPPGDSRARQSVSPGCLGGDIAREPEIGTPHRAAAGRRRARQDL